MMRGFGASCVCRAHFSKGIELKIFRSRFALTNNVHGRSKLCRTALRGMAINSGYYVRGVGGCVTGCVVKSCTFVRGMSVVLMSNQDGFKGNIRMTMLGRANKHRIPVRSHLSTRRTCVLTLCHRHPRLVYQVGTVVSQCTRRGTSSANAVNRRIAVISTKCVGGMQVNSCYGVRKTKQLGGNDLGDGRRTPVRVNCKIMYSSFVVSDNSGIRSKAVLAHYFVDRTYRLKRGCSTSSSLFFDGYRRRGNRTYTVFTKPFAIARRGSALLVTKVFSFVGTNSNSGRDGRVCGLNPVRRKTVRHKTGAASSSCVL